MTRVLQQFPVDFAIMAPFADLPDLAAHEEEFLSRVGPHERKIGAQRGKLLPFIARDFPVQRALAVYDFVMAERQDEISR